MKKIVLFFFAALTIFSAHTQETTLAPDQNPKYTESRDRYIKAQDQLLLTMNTTVQQTYKAYDWYEVKQDRKLQRYNDRRERRLLRAEYGNNYYNPYNNYYNQYSTPYRYAPGHNYRRNGWRWGW